MKEEILKSLVEFNEAKGFVSCYFGISHDKKDEFIETVESAGKSPFGIWILYDNCKTCGEGNYHAELIQDSEEEAYVEYGIEFIYKQPRNERVN